MAYRQLQITDKVRITDGASLVLLGTVKAVTTSSARVRFYCHVNRSYREQWFRQSSLVVSANTPVKPQYQTTPQTKEKPMTPAQELGYKVGDKFTMNRNCTFRKGAIITLFRDDGSTSPLFSSSREDTDFNCANGSPGAYTSLCFISPLVEPAKPQAPQFKVGDKVKVVSITGQGFESRCRNEIGTIRQIDGTSLPVAVRFEDGDFDWGIFEELALIGDKTGVPANVKEKLAEIARLTDDVARLTAEVQELLG